LIGDNTRAANMQFAAMLAGELIISGKTFINSRHSFVYYYFYD
jgi:hypothetical protein